MAQVRLHLSALAWLLGLSLAICAEPEAAPPPAATPCEVIVSGRTSTLKSIVVRKTGQTVPKISHGEHTCGNTPGFDWYVSQHYALKANVGDELAELFLTLAELAYPHYVEVIGREPPDIETTRMAFIHATNLETMQKAVISDIGDKWAGGGGGVTLPHSAAAYNFPSGALRYHRNDLSLHEGLHLLQMAVYGSCDTPLRFTEGITHTFSNHVYDPAKKQLTVAVFDKAPINNPLDAGLRMAREKGLPSIEDIVTEKTAKGWYPSAIALYTAFFWSDPDRLMKWRLWRDELLHARVSGGAQRTLDLDTVRKLHGGSLDGLNREWEAWIKERHTTFTHVDWGWEQWGETLQTYGWPWTKNLYSQMDLNYAPGTKLPPDPFRLDYPRNPKSPLVGTVQLGADEPSVGCVLDFKNAKNQGWAGLGLGVQGRDLMRVVVEQNKKLVLDGTRRKLNAGRQDVAFTPEFLALAQKTGRVGLTAKIAKTAVEVTLRAGEAEPFQEMAASYPLTPDERADLLAKHMALLSRDARHEITPYIEEPPAQPDYSTAAPANRWRFAGDKETYRLYRAAWRMGDKAPASLASLKSAMVTAMDKDAATQQAALTSYDNQIGQVVRDLRAADTPEARLALASLSGAAVSLSLDTARATGKPEFAALVTGAADRSVTATVTFSVSPKEAIETGHASERIEVAAGKAGAVRWNPALPAAYSGTFSVTARAEFAWRDATVSVSDTKAARSSIPCYWLIGPFDNKGGGTVDTPQAVESEAFQADKTYTGKDGKSIGWHKAARPADLPLEKEWVVDLRALYKAENASAYALVWVIAPKAMDAELAVGSDDGVVAWLDDKRVHANLVNRGHSSRSDRAPISLKAGPNRLLLKITQGGGDWKMAAHIEGQGGVPLPELQYSLEPPR